MFEHSGKVRSSEKKIHPLNKKIAKILHEQKSVLDIGCSSGRLAHYINKSCRYIGISYSEADLDVIRNKGYEGFLINLDKDSIPLEDGSIDCIFASHIIEHFGKVELIHVMQELKRILKKGGTIILTTPTDYNSFFYAERTHVRPYNHGSLPGLLNDFDFKKVDRMYPKIGFLPKFLQAILRFPLFFLKNTIWGEIVARGEK